MRKTPSRWQRILTGVLSAALVIAQWPPAFGPLVAEASHTGSASVSAGSVPPPNVTAIQAFQPDLFTGRATTAVPIAVPPGRKGLQPSLGLSYSSSARNGWVGVGWSLDVGSIELNTTHGVPKYDGSDTYTFLFQGVMSELVQIADGTYRAKDEGAFLRFVKTLEGNWEVTDKSGTHYFFGTAEGSRLEAEGKTFRWALEKILDLNGNFLTVSYTKDANQLYLAQIDYTGHETDGFQDLSPTNQVRFILNDIPIPRPDIETSYRAGFEIKTAKRLVAIETYATVDNVLSLARQYELAYTTSSRTGRSLLTSVTQIGWDGTRLPPMTFTYTQETPTYLLCTNCNPSYSTGNHGWQVQTHAGALFPREDGGNDQILWPSGYFEPGYKTWTENRCEDVKVCHSCWFFATCCDHYTVCYDYPQYATIPSVGWSGPVLTDGPGSGSQNGVSWSISANGNLSLSGPTDAHILAQTWVYSPSGGETISLSPGVGGKADAFSVVPGGSVWTHETDHAVSLSAGWTVIAVTAYNETGSLSLSLPDVYTQLGTGGAMNNAQFAPMRLTGDFNGDAITDIGRFESLTSPSKWFVTPMSPTGFQQEAEWLSDFGSSSDTPLVGDFNADGKVDVALFNAGSWRFATSTGSSFTEQAGWALSVGSGTPLIGDFNGDGLLDLGMFDNGTWTVALNTGEGFSTSGFSSFSWGSSSEQPLTGDFNGDGLTDIARVTESSGTLEVAFSTGSAFVSQPGPWISGFGNDQPHTSADVNGDGLTDVLYYDKEGDDAGTVYYAASTGQAFAASQPLVSNYFSSSRRGPDDVLQVGDFSGDGLGDPGVLNVLTGEAELGVSMGSPADLLQTITNGLGGSSTITYGHSSMFDNTGDDEAADLPFAIPVVTQVDASDGLGHTYTTTYRYSGGRYDATTKEFWGFATAEVIDAVGTRTETHFLQDAHLKGRMSLQQTLDAEDHLYTKTENLWSCTEPHPGVHFAYLDQADAFVYDGNESYRQATSRFVYDTQHGNLLTSYEDGWTVDVRVDASGNQTVTYPTGDERSTTTSYVLNESAWILNKPNLVQSFDAAGNLVAQRRFLYDEATDWATQPPPTVGQLTTEEVWLNLPTERWIATSMTYDPYGNVATVTDARRDAVCPSGCTTANTYDLETLTFLTGIANVIGHTRSMSYDPRTGQVTSSTDQNDLTTLTTYDDVGRVTATAYLDPQTGTEVPLSAITYDLTTVPIRTTTTVYSQPDAQGALTTSTFTDGLGRTIQTRAQAEDPTQQVVTGAVELDSRGQVIKQWVPYFSAVSTAYVAIEEEPEFSELAFVTYQYDPIGRLTATIDPDGSVTSTSYDDGSLILTDALGHTTYRTTDAYGQLIEVTEGITDTDMPTTFYTYDALNNLIQLTDAQGHVTSVTYDSLGRKLSMDDPDMGHWEYAYDDVDNLIRQTDANGRVLVFTYDALNRITQKAEDAGARPQGVAALAAVTYTYDNAAKAYAKGKLTEISDGEGANSSDFVYDALSRLVQESRRVNGTDYTIERSYDLLGRLTSLSYPDGDVVYYVYNAQGGLEQMFALVGGLPDPGEPEPDPEDYVWYITNIDYNAAGQLIKIEYGNGVVSDYTYDPQTLRLSSLVTQHASLGTVLQDLAYQFDAVGNVSSIADAVAGTSQTFTYDALNRLTQADGAYGNLPYTYDPIGNMTEKDGIAMTYGEYDAPPHAVTSTADGWLMSYDASGNLIGKTHPDGLRDLYTYDAENRLTQVERRDHSLVTVDVALSPGWNFITLPVEPDDYAVASVLASLHYGTDYDQISRYDAGTDAWQHYLNHPEGNEFDTMALGEAYAIYCLNPQGATWTITGHRLANIRYRALAADLNLLGMVNDQPLSVAEALDDLEPGVDYTALYHWNTATQDWDVYDGADQQEFTEIVPGEGYWLDTTAATSWPLPFEQGFTTFAYDGDGGRVSKTTEEGTTIYLGQLYEKAPDGTVTKSIFAGAQRIAQERIQRTTPLTIERFWRHGDHLGSTSVVTNEAGESVQQLAYTPYGSVFSNTGTEDFSQKFTGQTFDAETGLYFYNARYYDPHLGRFITPDPFVQEPGDPQTLNRYAYVRNNPINFVDPSGYFSFWKFWLAIGLMVLAIAAVLVGVSFALTGNEPAAAVSFQVAIWAAQTSVETFKASFQDSGNARSPPSSSQSSHQLQSQQQAQQSQQADQMRQVSAELGTSPAAARLAALLQFGANSRESLISQKWAQNAIRLANEGQLATANQIGQQLVDRFGPEVITDLQDAADQLAGPLIVDLATGVIQDETLVDLFTVKDAILTGVTIGSSKGAAAGAQALSQTRWFRKHIFSIGQTQQGGNVVTIFGKLNYVGYRISRFGQKFRYTRSIKWGDKHLFDW